MNNKGSLLPASIHTHSIWAFCIIIVGFTSFTPVRKVAAKTRVIVLTDITSLTAGYKEPDDGQSLIRLMLYSNELEIEGLLATSNLEHGQTVRPDLIRQVVEAYGKDRKNLLKHATHYPTAAFLLSKIKSGNPYAGRAVLLLPNIGEGKDTEASDWIIRVVDKEDTRPVWITIWGGATDLAQALWKVKATRSAAALKAFISKIRVRAIADQDGAGPWIRSHFPTLYYVLQKVSMRGMHRGGDTSLVSERWVYEYVKGRGALADLYPVYNGGDIWVRKLGPLKGIKEGDTPAFLSLLPVGLNDEIHPEWLSWGGRFIKDSVSSQFVDAVDSIGTFASDPHPTLASVYRWREVFQNDFAARMDWCIKPFAEANHAPQPVVKVTKTKSSWILDASRSEDMDEDQLSFSWWMDRAATAYEKEIALENTNDNTLIIPFSMVPPNQWLHILLEVKDKGHPPLTRYRRILVSRTNLKL